MLACLPRGRLSRWRLQHIHTHALIASRSATDARRAERWLLLLMTELHLDLDRHGRDAAVRRRSAGEQHADVGLQVSQPSHMTKGWWVASTLTPLPCRSATSLASPWSLASPRSATLTANSEPSERFVVCTSTLAPICLARSDSERAWRPLILVFLSTAIVVGEASCCP